MRLVQERERSRFSRVGALALALLMGVTACATGSVRAPLSLEDPEASQAEAAVAPLPTDFQPVRVDEAELSSALTGFVLQLPLRVVVSTPREADRRRVLTSTLAERDTLPSRLALQWGYSRFCEQRGSPGDCLSLLEDGPVLHADDLRAIALALAVGPALEDAGAEMKGLLNPTQVLSTVSFALATYLALLVLPEPISKGVSAFFTECLWGYLGWEFFELLRAYRQLHDDAPRAASFSELQEIGARFGRVIGPNSVRILVLLATASAGGELGPTAKGPILPGMAQASRMSRVRLGRPLMEVATATEQLIVSAPEGTLRLVLAPNVVAMAAGGGGAGGTGPRGQSPPKAYRAWRSFSGFKRAMGPAGPGKQWHHIVEQTPGNVGRFGGEALHNTENVIALDESLHQRLSSFYSTIRYGITGTPLTVRQWLSAQSYEAQAAFGLRAIENVRNGTW